MFESLPQKFRSHGVPADARTLLLFRKSMDSGLVNTLGDCYTVLKAIVVKDPKMIGPFSQAYYDYFLSIDIQPGEKLGDAVKRSQVFKGWMSKVIGEEYKTDHPDMEEFVNRFLDEIHLTTYDIKNMLDGKDILAKDNPNMEDKNEQANVGKKGEKNLDQAADYSGIGLEELLKRMEQVANNQRFKHEGGSHWIGTNGISPYGHSGAAKGGIRVGGQGGGKMARATTDDPRFYPVDLNKRLGDNNIDAALSALKGVFEESAQTMLDIPNTIENGLKRGGLFLPEEKDIISEKMQVILMVDNGGYSMDPHIKPVTTLFKKMKTRFAHDMETFYFHNTIYSDVSKDERRTERISIERLLAYDPNYTVFVVGDAAMAPYELNRQSIDNWKRIKGKFKTVAWLNPERENYWGYSQTIQLIKQLIPMYPLTPKGIEDAIIDMNKIKKKAKSG